MRPYGRPNAPLTGTDVHGLPLLVVVNVEVVVEAGAYPAPLVELREMAAVISDGHHVRCLAGGRPPPPEAHVAAVCGDVGVPVDGTGFAVVAGENDHTASATGLH